MISSNRDILVLLREEKENEQRLEKELKVLHDILHTVETRDNFCRSHELVTRYGISRKPEKIWKETRFYRLKPFYFLINKN